MTKNIQRLRIVTGFWLAALALVAGYSEGLGQGEVSFYNSIENLVRTNSVGLGGAAGNTATNLNGFSYALFIAPSTVTSLLPLDLLTPVWTFTGLYATNGAASPGGLLRDGFGVAVPGWTPSVTNSYVVAGWSANIAWLDWNAVAGQMAGASFTNGVWYGPNWLSSSDRGFFGVSEIGYGGPPGPISLLPPLNIFGPGPSGFGVPITNGFDLFVVSSPEPSAEALWLVGGLMIGVAGRYCGCRRGRGGSL
jgi:hypothetical protein